MLKSLIGANSQYLLEFGIGLGKISTYCRYFRDRAFWTKIAKYARNIGKNALEKLLILYFCAQDSDTPKWVKAVILGALGYFIVPLDTIPDFTPGLGFTDDISVVVLALGWVAAHVKGEHRKRAEEALKQWF